MNPAPVWYHSDIHRNLQLWAPDDPSLQSTSVNRSGLWPIAVLDRKRPDLFWRNSVTTPPDIVMAGPETLARVLPTTRGCSRECSLQLRCELR